MNDDLRDLQDPDLQFVPLTIVQLARAMTQVDSCEKCNPEAEIPFAWVLFLYSNVKNYAEYILPAPGRCPRCQSDIHEKTRVMPVGNPDARYWM